MAEIIDKSLSLQQDCISVHVHKQCHLKMSHNIAEKILEFEALCDLDMRAEPLLAGSNEPSPSQVPKPCELHVSRLCIDPHRNTLQPGLLLQGVVRGDGGADCVTGERLLQFGRLVMLRDLIARIGRRSVCAADHRAPANREVDREATEVSGLVRQFLLDLERLSGFVRAFTRALRYQVLAAIAWLNHARTEKRSQQQHQQLRECRASTMPASSLCWLSLSNCSPASLPPGLPELTSLWLSSFSASCVR